MFLQRVEDMIWQEQKIYQEIQGKFERLDKPLVVRKGEEVDAVVYYQETGIKGYWNL